MPKYACCGSLELKSKGFKSFVTGDKIYCIYRAPNEELIREHAELGGFPANVIAEVSSTIDPTTAEG